MTARNDRPASWWLLAELPLSVSSPTWCVEDASATVDRPLCFYHATQAVENGDLDPADVTIGPVPIRSHDAHGGH